MPRSVSAYVPCYNNVDTIMRAVSSVAQQTVSPDELFVVDDGSIDGSADLLEKNGFSVIRMSANEGRGAVRHRAISQAKHDLVLSCDARVQLSSDFLERAISWMKDEKVAAVHGRIVDDNPSGLGDRWRARHLFKMAANHVASRNALHATTGSLVRRATIVEVGNYDKHLRAAEDKELGRKLLAAGFDVVFDPALTVTSLASESVGQVLERYRRWHADPFDDLNIYSYVKQVAYSLKVMAVEDLRSGDWESVPVSLIAPHYQFWGSFRSKLHNRETHR